MAPLDKPIKYRTRWYRERLQRFTHHWQDSLKGLGTCSYHRAIPPDVMP